MRKAWTSTTSIGAIAMGVAAGLFADGCVIPIETTGNPGMTANTDGGPSVGTPVMTPDADLPKGSWTNVTSNLANMDSECGNLTSVFVKPDEDLIIAGVALHGLWGSRDGAMTWQQLGQGSGSAMITNHAQSLVWDPVDKMRFWEGGIYGSAGGVYSTSDDGTTFAKLGDVFHDNAVSVDLTDPMRRTLVAGGHEATIKGAPKLSKSSDGGMTWSQIDSDIPPTMDCTWPLVIDAQAYLAGCSGYGAPSGVVRTSDGGTTWTTVSTSGGAGLPLVASDGSIYWASPNQMGVARSTDQGKTWTIVGGGGLVEGSPIELPDQRLAALTAGYLVVSSDKGVSWKPASAALPYAANGVVYSAPRKAFFIWHDTCPQGPKDIPVPTDAVMRFDFDYQTE